MFLKDISNQCASNLGYGKHRSYRISVCIYLTKNTDIVMHTAGPDM